jgi:protein-tyrosine phosphatase
MTATSSDAGWLDLDGTVNARVVVPGVLLRSDNLQDLSDRDVQRLIEDEGLEVVLDLRTDVEVELEGPGPLVSDGRVRIEHRSLHPDTGDRTDFDAETVNPWRRHGDEEFLEETPVVRAYMSYLRRRPDSIVAGIRTIADSDGAVLVHCAAGKDRTGVIVALALDAVGVPRETIAADYLRTGERIVEILDRLVSSETYRAELEGHDPDRHAPTPGTIERVLELVDEGFGGAAGWLRAHGLAEHELARLSKRLA